MLMPKTLSTLTLAAALLALAAGAPGASAEPQTLAGHWSGVVSQSGPSEGTQQFVATLTLNGATGAMDYPTLECGGDVAFVSRSSAGYVYRETISRGRGCLSGGTITVQPSTASVYWRWDGAAGVTVSGRLYRVATAPTAHAAAAR
jgi:hypothetical protein